MESDGGPPPPLPREIVSFKILVSSYGKRKANPIMQQFVKNVDIPFVELPTERPCWIDLNLSKHGLIGNKEIDGWI